MAHQIELQHEIEMAKQIEAIHAAEQEVLVNLPS